MKGSPKLWDENRNICPNLATLMVPWVDKLIKYMTIKHRHGVLKGWLANTRLGIEGRLCADADTHGAVSGRYTHRIVANVPRVTTEYGKEMRSLFTVPCNKVMVGWDASSLEAMIEAHYLYAISPIAARKMAAGTEHDDNAARLEITRDEAKRFKYAITYGATAPRLADIFGWDIGAASALYDEFWFQNDALKMLRDRETRFYKRHGFIRGLDGRKLFPRSEHSVLNLLFQSGGAILMKYASVIVDKLVEKHELRENAQCLIKYHDEEEWEVDEQYGNFVGALGVQSIELASKYLNLNVNITGEYKVGNNWAECH